MINFFLIMIFLILNTGSQSDFLESNFQEIVYPTVISREEIRRRRSLFDIDENSIFISLSNWTLKTKLNSALIIPSYFDIDWIHLEEIKNEKSKFPLNCQAVRGIIDNEENNSLVILTICQKEFYGLMLIENRYFFLQPIKNGKHLLFEDKNINWKSIKNDNNLLLKTNKKKEFRYENLLFN